MKQQSTRKSEARLAIEAFLSKQKSPVTVLNIRDATGLDSKLIHNTLNSVRRVGQLDVSGASPNKLYRMIASAQIPKPQKEPKQAARSDGNHREQQPSSPKPAAEVIYPPGYRHTICATPEIHRSSYRGENWNNSAGRADCFDHEKISSRRGDTFVGHRPPLSMQHGSPRGPGSRLLADLQRIAGQSITREMP